MADVSGRGTVEFHITVPGVGGRPVEFLPRVFFGNTNVGQISNSWYEAWLVKKDQKLGTADALVIPANIRRVYEKDEIEIPATRFDDFFMMPAAGRVLNDEKATETYREKTRGWIKIDAVAHYYDGMTEKDLTDNAFIRDNKATGAGHLYSIALGSKTGNEGALSKKNALFGEGGCPKLETLSTIVHRQLFVWWDSEKENGKTHVLALPLAAVP
jgi:hypothetical protein